MIRTVSTDTLNSAVEFDCPFMVIDSNTIQTTVHGVHAPDVFHDEEDDIEIQSASWEALTGYTGQYSYNGAVMHASEFLGGRLASDVLDEPGVYVITAVMCYDDDEPAGWAILKYVDEDAPCCIAFVTSGGSDHTPDCK